MLEPLCLPEIAARLREPDDLAKERLLHVLGYQEGWATWLAARVQSLVESRVGPHFDTSLMAFEVAANGVAWRSVGVDVRQRNLRRDACTAIRSGPADRRMLLPGRARDKARPIRTPNSSASGYWLRPAERH